MPLVQPNDVMKVTAQFTWDDTDIFQNVYHIQLTSLIAEDDADVVTQIAVWLDTAYTEFNWAVSTKLDYDQIEVYNVTQDRPMMTVPWPVLVQGAEVADPLPTQCAALVSFPTGVKRRVGKKYLAGMGEPYSIDGGKLAQALKDSLADFAVYMITTWAGGGMSLEAGVWNGLLMTFTQYASGLIDDLFRTQRRRVQGVGA